MDGTWIVDDPLDEALQDKVMDPFSNYMSFGFSSYFSNLNTFQRYCVVKIVVVKSFYPPTPP